jgi:hypothetical protein
VDQVICWLTGYDARRADQITRDRLRDVLREAPALNPNVTKITVPWWRAIENIEHPLMRNIRYMDKLVDELAKGRPMEKILRA